MELHGEPNSKPFLAFTPQSLQTALSFKPLEYLPAERRPSSPPIRRTANYQPSLWDDFYIQSLPNGSLDEAQVGLWEKLREEIKQLIGKQEDTAGQLEFIDAVGQLGVSYHFQDEIKNALGFIASSFGSLNDKLPNNLHASALLFRLLTEHGLEIPHLSLDDLLQGLRSCCESSELTVEKDVKGILGLYEACFLAVGGEDEVDEAIEYLTKLLVKLREKQLSASLLEQIDHALELPLHWRMPRLHTRWFIDAYEKQDNTDPKLLRFAKLDFNLLQSIYKKELKEMSRWWKNLGLTSFELPFARDRLVENYLWAMGCSYEPQLWRCRVNIAKFGCLLTTIDDVYDVYGSLDELQLFTIAIIEWNINAIQHLPNYMKIILRALFNTINDVANTVSTEKGLKILPRLKREWEDQCKAYLVEAMWYHSRYTPKLNEYLDNAWITIGSPTIISPASLLSEDLTAIALEKLELYPDVIRYSGIIVRLSDDLGTSTDELQRGDVSKSIQCYMKEKNVSETIARGHIRYLIRQYWKVLNGKKIGRSKFEESFKRVVVNFPRMAMCIYQYGDGHGKPNHETRERVISLLIEPIAL